MATSRTARAAPTHDLAYQQVAAHLRMRVEQLVDAGLESRLPTEAELADQFEVSRQTIRRAMQDLVNEGLVYRVRGRGTFPILKRGGHYLRQIGSIEDLLALSDDTVMEIVAPPALRIDSDAAARLRCPSDSVVTLAFRRLTGGVAFCYTTVHLRPEIAQLISDHPDLRAQGTTSAITIIGLIEERLPNGGIVEAEQSISVAEMPVHAAESLGCQPGSPAMRIDRTYTDRGQAPLEAATSFFRPDYYSYRVTLQRRNSYT